MATATSATLYKSAPSVPGREPEHARDARGRPRFRGFYFWYVSAFAPAQELHFSVLPAHSLALPRRAARAAWSADTGARGAGRRRAPRGGARPMRY